MKNLLSYPAALVTLENFTQKEMHFFACIRRAWWHRVAVAAKVMPAHNTEREVSKARFRV